MDAVSWGALGRALPGRLRLAGSRRGTICRICPRAPARKASSSRSREKIFSEAGKKTGTCPQQPSLSSFFPCFSPQGEVLCFGEIRFRIFFISGDAESLGPGLWGSGLQQRLQPLAAASCCPPGRGLVVNQIRIFSIYRKYLPKYCYLSGEGGGTAAVPLLAAALPPGFAGERVPRRPGQLGGDFPRL